MDVATMRRAFPGLSAARAAELNSGLNAALRLAGCTTVKRAAMFCAQVGEESISLTTPTELASGAEYERRADLGNTQPGDGVRFKGRGFIQITGRFDYGELSRWAHAKGLAPSVTYLIDHPEQLATDLAGTIARTASSRPSRLTRAGGGRRSRGASSGMVPTPPATHADAVDYASAVARIYQRAGFTLDDEQRHHSFGQDLTGQNWSRDL